MLSRRSRVYFFAFVALLVLGMTNPASAASIRIDLGNSADALNTPVSPSFTTAVIATITPVGYKLMYAELISDVAMGFPDEWGVTAKAPVKFNTSIASDDPLGKGVPGFIVAAIGGRSNQRFSLVASKLGR